MIVYFHTLKNNKFKNSTFPNRKTLTQSWWTFNPLRQLFNSIKVMYDEDITIIAGMKSKISQWLSFFIFIVLKSSE